jgi:hypothetical protein
VRLYPAANLSDLGPELHQIGPTQIGSLDRREEPMHYGFRRLGICQALGSVTSTQLVEEI